MENTDFTILQNLTIKPEWIDYNGHMNVAYYVLAFDQSLDILLDHIELTTEYRDRTQSTVYVLETHVCYLREVKEDDPITIKFRIIDCDEKRIHLFLEMFHTDEGFLAATSEQMILHIDMSGPKASPMPDYVYAKLAALQKNRADEPLPRQVGATIGIRKK